jgi:hypothetical protein
LINQSKMYVLKTKLRPRQPHSLPKYLFPSPSQKESPPLKMENVAASADPDSFQGQHIQDEIDQESIREFGPAR